jgi:hypothetical protein
MANYVDTIVKVIQDEINRLTLDNDTFKVVKYDNTNTYVLHKKLFNLNKLMGNLLESTENIIAGFSEVETAIGANNSIENVKQYTDKRIIDSLTNYEKVYKQIVKMMISWVNYDLLEIIVGIDGPINTFLNVTATRYIAWMWSL